MTIETGIRKYDAKKPGMAAKYRIDVQRWVDGLTRAGAAPGPMSREAYANSASYARENYATAIQGATGAYWAERFRAGIGR